MKLYLSVYVYHLPLQADLQPVGFLISFIPRKINSIIDSNVLIVYRNNQVSAVEADERPKIMPDQENITVSPGDNLTLTCHGTNVTWNIYGVIKRKK